MARPRAATYEDQRAQILQAAADLFARRGYTAATLNEVAVASGVSKATLYHYFHDKEQLLFEIANEHVQRLVALVNRVDTLRLAPALHLQSLIEHFLQAYGGAENAHRVLTEDVKFLGPEARQAVEDCQRRVVQAFAEAVADVRPDLGSTLHKPLAMLLFGMINWTFTWLKPDRALTHAELAPIVVQVFLGGLQALDARSAPQQGQDGR